MTRQKGSAKSQTWKIIRTVAANFGEDEVLARAAALAFYSALGLAPMILLFITVSSFLGNDVRDRMIEQIESLAGPAEEGFAAQDEESQLAKGIEDVIENARKRNHDTGVFAAVIAGLTLLFSASGVFAQLQASLNKIWKVRVKPGVGVWLWLRARLLSMGMVLAILFLLLVSLIVSAAISMIVPGSGAGWSLINAAVSALVFTAAFMLIFKFLPDVHIRWRDVAFGAALTAVLFAIGKYLIGLYIGNLSLSSSYGAAGSFLAVLIWVYYSSVIVYLGAEITEVVAEQFGPGIQPSSHAERL